MVSLSSRAPACQRLKSNSSVSHPLHSPGLSYLPSQLGAASSGEEGTSVGGNDEDTEAWYRSVKARLKKTNQDMRDMHGALDAIDAPSPFWKRVDAKSMEVSRYIFCFL